MRLALVGALVANVLVLAADVTPVRAAGFSISIPSSTVARGAPGATVFLTRATTPGELVGRTCSALVVGVNQDSVHPDSDLSIGSRETGQGVIAPDVEAVPNAETPAAGTFTIGATVDTAVTLGADGVFSGGVRIDIDCDGPTGVTPEVPVFAPGTCEGPGSLVVTDTEAYTWEVSGPDGALVATATANPGYTLAGQTVFGPYDITQLTGSDCETCGLLPGPGPSTTVPLVCLRLLKLVDGGPRAADEWLLSAVGEAPGNGVDGQGSAEAWVSPDTFELSESGPDDYVAGRWDCDGGALADGRFLTLSSGDGSVTCEITNSPRVLRLEKVVVNDDGGTNVESDWELRAVGSANGVEIIGTGPTVGGLVVSDTYVLSETGLVTGTENYVAGDWRCEDSEGVPRVVVGDVLTVSATDGSMTCRIVNDDKSVAPSCPSGSDTSTTSSSAPPTTVPDEPCLRLVKEVDNRGVGSAVAPDWELTASRVGGAVAVSGAGSAEDVVSPGEYRLSEVGLVDRTKGYVAGEWSCADADGVPKAVVGGVLTVSAGDVEVECTIVNTARVLRLEKFVQNDDGGIASPEDWALSATDERSDIMMSGAGAVEAMVAPGSYQLSEVGLVDGTEAYSAGDWECTGKGTLEAGRLTVSADDVTVSCTIINDDPPIEPGVDCITLDGVPMLSYVLHSGGIRLSTVDVTISLLRIGGQPQLITDVTRGSGLLTHPAVTSDDPADAAGGNFVVSVDGVDTASVAYPAAPCPAPPLPVEFDCQVVPHLRYDFSDLADPGDLVTVRLTDLDGEPAALYERQPLRQSILYPGASDDPADWPGWQLVDGSWVRDVSDDRLNDGGALTVEVDGRVVGQVSYPPTPRTWCLPPPVPPTTLRLVADVVNDDGGTADPSDWDLVAEHSSGVDIAGPGPVVQGDLGPGDYELRAESRASTTAGYIDDGWSCDVRASVGGRLKLLTGDGDVTCTIRLDDPPPPPRSTTLQLGVEVVNDDGGTEDAGAWALAAEDLAGRRLDFGSGSEPVSREVQPTTYQLMADGPDLYDVVGWVCNGEPATDENRVTLDAGDTAVCTVTVDDPQRPEARLRLEVDVVNDDGGTAGVSDWELTARGPDVVGPSAGPVVGGVVEPGDYTLSVRGPDDYDVGAWECRGRSAVGDRVDLAADDVVTCTVTVDDRSRREPRPVVFAVLEDVVSGGGDLPCDVETFRYRVRLFNLSAVPVTAVLTTDGSAPGTAGRLVLSLDLADRLQPDGSRELRKPVVVEPGEDESIAFWVRAPLDRSSQRTFVSKLTVLARPTGLQSVNGDLQEPTVMSACQSSDATATPASPTPDEGDPTADMDMAGPEPDLPASSLPSDGRATRVPRPVVFAVLEDVVREDGDLPCDVDTFTYQIRLFNLSAAPVTVVLTPAGSRPPDASDRLVLSLDLADDLLLQGSREPRKPVVVEPGQEIEQPITFRVRVRSDRSSERTFVSKLAVLTRPAELESVTGDLQEPTVVAACEGDQQDAE